MSPLTYKVFNPQGEYVAACKHPSEAAILVAVLGDESEIRNGHTKRDRLWHEGHEVQSASESYDFVAETIHNRETGVHEPAMIRRRG